MRFPFPCFLAAISVAVASSKEEDAVVSRTLKFSKKHPPPPGPQRPTPSPNTQQWTCARCMEDPQHGCMSKDSGCSACPACVNVQTRCQDLNGEKNVSQVSNIQSYIMMCVNLTMVNETAYYIGDRLYTQFKNETYAIVDKYKSQSTSPFDKDKELLLIQQTYKELFDYTYNMQNVLGDFTSLFEESGEAKHFYLEQSPYATKVHNTMLIMDYLVAAQFVQHGNATDAWKFMTFAAHDVSKLWGNGVTGWILATYTTGRVRAAILQEGDETENNLRVHLEALLFPAMHVWPGVHDNLGLAFEQLMKPGYESGLTPTGFSTWLAQFNDLGRLYGIHSCILMYYLQNFPQLFNKCQPYKNDPNCYMTIAGPRPEGSKALSGNVTDPVAQSIRVPYMVTVGKAIYDKRHNLIDPNYKPIPAVDIYLDIWFANMSRVVNTTKAEQRWIKQARKKRGFIDFQAEPQAEQDSQRKCPFFNGVSLPSVKSTSLSGNQEKKNETTDEYNKKIINILYGGFNAKGWDEWPHVCKFANQQPRTSWSKASLAQGRNFQDLIDMKLNFNPNNISSGEFWSSIFLLEMKVDPVGKNMPGPEGMIYPPTAFSDKKFPMSPE